MAQQFIELGEILGDATGTKEKLNGNFSELYAAAGTALTHRVIVNSADDLAGTLDSTQEYFIDGIIDMGSQSIEVPAGGLNLTGYNFDASQLISTATGYTMFTSPAGGSGNVLGKDYGIDVSGTSSQVYNIAADTGAEAFEFARINYNNCTSLGTISGYRQGLEVGSGRFGGSPTLTLAGTWAGGYFIDTSIVRGLDAAMNAPLFAAGAGFTMASRFRSNMNVDLGATGEYFDFAPANFLNASTLQLEGSIVTRNGVVNSADANITPNIDHTDIASSWTGNVGVNNTFVGGMSTISTETATTIVTQNVFVDLAGTYTASNLQHFDSPANGQLRHLGASPREYKIYSDLSVDGTANDDLRIKVVKWDDSASGFVDVFTQARQVNNLSGARNVAFFNISINTELDANDFLKLQVANATGTDNVTVELDSYYIAEQR